MAETEFSGPFEPDLDHTSVGKCCESFIYFFYDYNN